MKKVICIILSSILVAMTHAGAIQENETPIINLMIDVDVPPSPNIDEVRVSEVNLHSIFTAVTNRGGTGTILLTQDAASSRIRLILAQYTTMSNFEFAVSGKSADDKLSTLPLSEQEVLISRSIEVAKAAKVCGLSEVEVLGFMPPSFDQNEDTYRAIDELGIEYDAGFQAGLISTPGHEYDVWPYQVEGYNFYAVPISTVEVAGELVPLYDRAMNEGGVSSSEWQDILVTKLDETATKGEPMVVLLSTSTSATGDYLEALAGFLDYAVSKDAVFVNTRDLVTIITTGSLPLPQGGIWECPTCGQDGGMYITITREIPETPSSDNESEMNEEIEQEEAIA